MARLSPSLLGLALFVIIALAAAEDKCRSGCQGVTPSTFKYAEGTTYKYNLESNIDISVSSADGQQSTTKLKATVLLTQLPQCNQILRLQNVQLFGPDGKKHGNVPDIEKAVRLNFHDGHVEDVICAEHGDSQNSLNIKRAVASLFQSAMSHHHETDVFGVCPTEFHTHKDGNVMTVTKSRALNKCGHRESVKPDFLSTAFNLNSEIKSSPVLKADYTAEQRIKDGILDHVLVTENYLYLPFSVGKNGAKAVVQTKLAFAGKSKDAPKPKCVEPKSIIFENPHPMIAQKGDVPSILQAVKDTANTIKQTVSDNTAGKFSNLIKIMSESKKDDLLAVYNQVKSGAGFTDKVIAKKVFLDALFRAGTGESVEVAIELLKSKELSPLEQRMVYLGMSFVRHATPGSLTSVATLLDLPNLPREAYLGVGTVAGKYCKSHDCKNVEQLNKLTQKLLSKLKDGKPATREQENESIAVLKALANMKHLIDAAVPKIVAIAQDKKNPARIRVAALETYASDACKDKFRDSAISILKDIQQDSEIRIKAYLALAQCPNGKVANAVKNVLDNEPSYQVGGFIVSHIRNLRASANPDKELAKSHLGNIKTMKKFPIDPRKYSMNNEFSYSVDTLGLSSSAESNLIYSQSSFLPRSVCVNLTTEIFGHKMNFLEVDMRQENLDRVLEHYFGPLGEFMDRDIDDMVNEGKEAGDKVASTIKERLTKARSKRQVPKAELDAISKQVQIKTNDLNTDLDIDISLKLFGSEFMFLSLNEENHDMDPEKIINKLFDQLENGAEKLKSFDHTFNMNNIIIDSELSYPTAMGFPLRLSIEGTSTAQLKISGGMDLKALSSDKDTILKLSMIPSGNVQITGNLLIDTSSMVNGLKTISTLYTATGGAMEMEIFNKGNGKDIKFKLPLEKQHLIDASHEIVFTHREAGRVEALTPLKFVEKKDFSICFDHLSPMIGLTACVELNNPNYNANTDDFLPFPLNGNYKMGVWLERDIPLTYHIRDVTYETGKVGAEFMLETLDDKNQRKLSFAVELQVAPEMFVTVTLDSPIKKAILEGRVVNGDQEKSISAKFQHDQEEYSGKFGFAVSGSGGKMVYTPLIEYKTPGTGVQKSPYTVEGNIIVEEIAGGKKYTLDNVKLVAPNQPTYTITGSVSLGNVLESDITVSNGGNSGSFKAKLAQDQGNLIAFVEMKNTMSPISNFRADYKMTNKPNGAHHDFALIHGNDLTDKKNRLTIESLLLRSFVSKDDYLFHTDNKIKYPLVGVEAELELYRKPKHLKFEMDGKYNELKAGTELDLVYNKAVVGDYDMKFKAHAMDNKLKLEAKRDVKDDKSKIDNEIDINGKKFELEGTLTHRIKPNDVEVGAVLTFKCPYHEPLSIDHNLATEPEKIKTHLKISRPSTVFVDFDLKAGRIEGANGHLKVDIPEAGKIDGAINAEKWDGKAHLILDCNVLKRKMKLDSSFKLQEPTYNIALNIYPNFEKEQKKITLVSNNQCKGNSWDSKNSLDFFGQVLEMNTKGSKEGEILEDGKIVSETEVILPNQVYLAGKIMREVHLKDGVGSGNALIALEQRPNKNTPGNKINLKGVAKSVDLNKMAFDIAYDLEVIRSGNAVNAELNLKRDVVADGSIVNAKGKLSGMGEPYELDGNAKYHDGSASYDVKLTHGANNLALKGKYQDSDDENEPTAGNLDFEMTRPTGALTKIKASIFGSILMKDDNIDLGGSTKIYVDGKEGNIIDISEESTIKMSPHHGEVKSTLKFQKEDPISVAMSYGHKEEESGATKCHCDIAVSFMKNKNAKAEFTLLRPTEKEYTLDAKLDAPFFENFDVIKFHNHAKRSDDSKHVTSDTMLSVDDKNYKLDHSMIISETSPMFKMELTYPDGKVDKLYAKANSAGNKQFSAEIATNCHKYDFEFAGSIDCHVQSAEDFVITIKAHSPKLNLKELVMEVKNQHNKATKIIEAQATSEGKNLLKGSANYKTREEGGKYIVEGSGEFVVKEEKKTGNFKFIRQNLSEEKNGEQGVQMTLNAGLGNKAVDTEFKLTNKHFRLQEAYCEVKGQCANFEIDSKTNVIDVMDYHHELEVNIDLRKLGLLHEFGLKAVTKRKQFLLDHTVDVHFQSAENNKYQYSLYVHPKEAGVSLTTPKRQIAIEGHINVPNKGKGPLKGELAFFLDKKAHPDKKTAIFGTAEVVGDKKHGAVKAMAKFTTPGLAKDLSVKYDYKYNVADRMDEATLELDIFNRPNNKLVIFAKEAVTMDGANGHYSLERHASIKSAGMNIEFVYDDVAFSYDRNTHTYRNAIKTSWNIDNKKCASGFFIELSPTKFQSMARLFDKEIYDIESKMEFSKESQVVDTLLRVHGIKPVLSHLEIKNYNTLKYEVACKEHPDNKLVINSAIIPGQIADFRAEIGKNELLHASIKLDEANFLKPDYGISSEKIEKLMLEPAKEEMKKIVDEGKNLVKHTVDHLEERGKMLRDIGKKNIPNLKPAAEFYKNELAKLKEEVSADKTVQQVAEILDKMFTAVMGLTSEILGKVNRIIQDMNELGKVNFDKFVEIYNVNVVPLVNAWSMAIHGWVEEASRIFFLVLGQISHFLDEHQAELKQIATSFSAVAQDASRFLYMNYERIRHLLEDYVKRIYEEVKALPIYEELQQRYQQFVSELGSAAEPAINIMKDSLNTIRDVVPNEDVKKLITEISEYLEKKMRSENVDDLAVIERILKNAVMIVKKLLSSVDMSSLKWGELADPSDFTVNYFTALPKLVASQFSPLNFLLESDDFLDEVDDNLYGVSFNPNSWIPPFRLYAFVIQGQHIFTFDGKHVTFPGKCNYLLARDAVNGNFTIAGTYTNGLLTALTVSDKTDSFTIKKGGQLMHNKDAVEWPFRKPMTAAYRLYDTVNIASKAGLEVNCDPELTICRFSVSGYYHGKLRGLLGNGNNEPYDDFTMANGKIVTSESDFGNSYKMAASCGPIKTVDHSTHQHAPACTKLFDSPELKFCYPFVNIENFRQACDHGVASGVPDTERAIAAGYVAACNSKYIPIRMPEEYVQCKNSEEPRKIGDKFSVKLPAKAADIVLLVDLAKTNEPLYKDLIKPVVSELTKELASKGIKDIEYHLITHGGDFQEYPSHVTTGSKLTWKGKLPNLKFSEEPPMPTVDLGDKNLNDIAHMIISLADDLDLMFGFKVHSQAFVEASKYPFRSQASRILISFMGSECGHTTFFDLHKLKAFMPKDHTVHYNLVIPMPNLKLKDAKVTKNLIGFNKENVFTISDAKKNPDGTSDLRDEIKYDDYCIDYTIRGGGNVFSAGNFLEAKDKKSYIQVIVHNIVDQVTNTIQGMDCECKYSGSFVGVNKCKVVHSEEKGH